MLMCKSAAFPHYLIISVHRTASWSSISLSLYWFLSISTLAISTLVKRFLWAVGTSLCASMQINPHMTTNKHIYSHGSELHLDRNKTNVLHIDVQKTHIFFIFSFLFHLLHLKSYSGKHHLLSCYCVLLFYNLQAEQ